MRRDRRREDAMCQRSLVRAEPCRGDRRADPRARRGTPPTSGGSRRRSRSREIPPVTVGHTDWLPVSTSCQLCSRPMPGTSITGTPRPAWGSGAEAARPAVPIASNSRVFFSPGSIRLVSVEWEMACPRGEVQLWITAFSQVSQGARAPSGPAAPSRCPAGCPAPCRGPAEAQGHVPGVHSRSFITPAPRSTSRLTLPVELLTSRSLECRNAIWRR